MPSTASIHQSQVQTEAKERPQNRSEGTGPYGATLKQGLLSKPLEDTHKLLPMILITKSDIEIKGHIEESVVGRTVQIDGAIEFVIESKDDVIVEPVDDVKMADDRRAALDAAPGVAVAQSVIGCEIKTKGIKFGKRRD
ncbi:hypothetical protein SAMD00023353_1300020 [Rosellinia necatrix]|uniref:Uncharacterized protein n=1 Tax=Rosellinia necatrix TaxID=77044 RepID=A0A1W2TCP5_ROSNE|nr:hypothetical protein SAMD00023353_1300020 [Rosellinia necatrix]